MHEYYTPKTNKMQGFLVIFTIFVDYAHFYVNMIMSTKKTAKGYFMQKICITEDIGCHIATKAQNIDFASCLAKIFM